MTNRPSLEAQSQMIGWQLSSLRAERTGKKTWSADGINGLSPEEVVARTVLAKGANCCWCEGGAVNLLLKASLLPTLARRNIFNDREDAIRRFLEAQLTVLSDFEDELIKCAMEITPSDLRSNILEICTDTFIQDAYPRVKADFVCMLSESVPIELRVRILEMYMVKPYDYRAGWPDLTVIDGDGVSFIEVKTTDRFHGSQIRFAKEIAAPLRLKCQVVQVVPMV